MIKIEYQQLLFLYAYLRHIDLSLDRCRWTSWNEFQDYFSSMIQPIRVIEYLKINFQLPDTDLEQFVFIPEKKTIIKKVKSTIAKSQLLDQNEILYCCKLLWFFDKELKSDNIEYNLDIEKLRMDVSKFYSETLELLISYKDLNRVMKVEHYEQSANVEVVEMRELVPNDF